MNIDIVKDRLHDVDRKIQSLLSEVSNGSDKDVYSESDIEELTRKLNAIRVTAENLKARLDMKREQILHG